MVLQEQDKDPPFGLRFLKENWVDPGVTGAKRNKRDAFAIIIGVRAEIGEFIVNAGVTPRRHINTCVIPMNRVKVIYDPRRVVIPTGVDLDLKDPTKLLR